jgi:hypothetical protein
MVLKLGIGLHSPFPSQSDNGPVIAVGISLLLNLCRERNGTHNAVAEFLIEHCLVRVSIVLYNLI